jgi:predicted ATPase
MLSLVGDNTISGRWVDELDTIAAEQGFLFWRAVATIFRGWMNVKNGDVPDGLSLLRGGLEVYRAAGADQWIPYFFGLLASACEIAEQFEEGMTLLDEALQIVERTGERWFAAELSTRASCCCARGIRRPPRNFIAKL